ncbi:hypothetical protein ACFVTE_18565 [Arthrobacter sp. NPDC058097]|uniref:ATP-dependent DNA ligase n=1 Tax=Arthrobacter sp. NPDC058097 TaxID=3346340 RepID=UPI0036DB5029
MIDGEAVIWSQGRLNFTALQQRLGAGPKTLSGLAAATPANYVAFDVLAVAGHDARDLPLSQRRALLEELGDGWEPPSGPARSTHGGRHSNRRHGNPRRPVHVRWTRQRIWRAAHPRSAADRRCRMRWPCWQPHLRSGCCLCP